ncbi:MAG: LamG domain-containing protein [Armatimonadetes bacterium]|nr:LamG domain-containing protein [Armatimonadota bacterium]
MRKLYFGAFGIFILGLSAPAILAAPVATWRFESEKGDIATDSVSGIQDALMGLYKYSDKGVAGKCLKLDGFTSYVIRSAVKAPELTGPFTIEAWVALQNYPWNWTAIVDRNADKKEGYFLGIDFQGAIAMNVAVDGKWVECGNSSRDYSSILHTNGWEAGGVHTMIRSDSKFQFSVSGVGDLDSNAKIPSNTWTHIAVVYSSSDKSCKIFINGKLDSARRVSRPVAADFIDMQIGGWNGGKRNFNGKMDDLRIYGCALTDADITDVAAGKGPSAPAAWWKFDETSGENAADSAGGKNGKLVGGAFGQGKIGNALILDGTDQHIEAPAVGKFNDFTMAVWVNPIIQSTEIPLHTWTHVVGTYDPASGIAVYMNGKLVGSKPVTGKLTEAADTDLLIGMSHEKLPPARTERGPSMLGSPMLLDGLIDEVKIYDSALSPDEIIKAYASAKPADPKPLSYWQMPTAALGKAEFGAINEELKYGDSWDSVFRMSGPADVVVKFDEMPVNYVFWHGWNYGLCMVSENGLLMADQSVERGNENGCTEHMSDKQDRYSHINIVENNNARVALHWRYNPCDIFYNETNLDPKTNWGDWVDEYFYIYPDGVMMRDQKFWTTGYVEKKSVGGYGGSPSNQETIFFSQPGKGPLDTVDVIALTVANDAGESQTFAWQPDFPWSIGREPAKPTIQMVNFRSTYKPYMIRRPGATIAAFPPSGGVDRNFPYWNHWPVSLLPNDGRQATRTDRPAHTSLAWFCEPPIKSEGILHTWIYMYGLTDKKATELTTLSKSWNSPAALSIKGGNITSQSYDTCQHAYLLTSATPGKPSKVDLTLGGSANTPVLNPAFVIKGWGDNIPNIKINGKLIAQGKDCRIGINYELDGADMVIWLKTQAASPVTVSITPSQASASGYRSK